MDLRNDICPCCGSDEIDCMDSDEDEDSISEKMVCYNCDAGWWATFSMQLDGIVVFEEGNREKE